MGTGRWKAPRTGSLERLPYAALRTLRGLRTCCGLDRWVLKSSVARMEQWRWHSEAHKGLFKLSTLCCVAALLLLSDGCSSSRQRRQGFARVVTPHPPAFLTGPASVLLTNSTGFSGRVEVQGQSSLEFDRTTSGQLLGRGTKLLYAPESNEATDTHRQPGGYSFIWDVAESRGYVLSEALQGYAPVSADLHVTNVTIELSQGAAQRFSGHPSEPAHATVRMSNGSSAGFELLRAIDLKGFPVQIEGTTNAIEFRLSFSKLRLEQPPADIFSPPDGFTKYATPEAMADELAVRQSNFKRKGPELTEPLPGMQPGMRY